MEKIYPSQERTNGTRKSNYNTRNNEKDILATRQQMLEDGIKFYKNHNEALRNELISYFEIKATKLIHLNDLVQRTKLDNEIKLFHFEAEEEIIKLQMECIKSIQVQHENLQDIRNI